MHNHTKRSGTRRCSLLACLAFVALLQNSCCFKVDLEALGGSEDISLRPNNGSPGIRGLHISDFLAEQMHICRQYGLAEVHLLPADLPGSAEVSGRRSSRSASFYQCIRLCYKQVCLGLALAAQPVVSGLVEKDLQRV